MRITITETQLELLSEQLDVSQFKKASELRASQWYWDHTRNEESLKCKAYNNNWSKLLYDILKLIILVMVNGQLVMGIPKGLKRVTF